MAFHAPAGRGARLRDRTAGPRRRNDHHAGEDLGPFGGNPGGSASLLAIIARKPRIWGESPIRNDFPETVRALLDRMDARTRSNLLDDIRAVAADCGFAATVKAVETVIDAGRTVDRAAIGTCAKRILEGAGTEGGQDLKRYDKYMKAAE